MRSVSKRTLQSGFRRSRGSRLIRVKETAVASGSSDKVRNKGGTAELFALYAERRFCIEGFLYYRNYRRNAIVPENCRGKEDFYTFRHKERK